MTETLYIFTIDTEQYAGNFERQMTAYMTAQIGDCEVGEELVDDALESLSEDTIVWLAENICQIEDGEQCARPCAIQPTPGWCNDGSGKHWRPGTPDDVMLAFTKKTGCEQCENEIREIHNRIDIAVTRNTPRAEAERQWSHSLKAAEERLARFQAQTEPNRYPAYQSVGIFMGEEPPATVVQELKARAHAFADGRVADGRGITITGFRLVTSVTTTTSTSISRSL